MLFCVTDTRDINNVRYSKPLIKAFGIDPGKLPPLVRSIDVIGTVLPEVARDLGLPGGVRVIGFYNLPGRVPVHASPMYAANVASLVEHFWDKERKSFKPKLEAEIMRGCLVVPEGEFGNEMIKKARVYLMPRALYIHTR